MVGVTPCEVEVAVDDRVLELRLAGHQARILEVPLVENAWVAGNVLTCGIGMVVDELCGALGCRVRLHGRFRSFPAAAAPRSFAQVRGPSRGVGQ